MFLIFWRFGGLEVVELGIEGKMDFIMLELMFKNANLQLEVCF